MPKGIPKNPRPSKSTQDTTDAFIAEEGEGEEDLTLLREKEDLAEDLEDLDGLRVAEGSDAKALEALELLERKNVSIKTAIQWLMQLANVPARSEFKPARPTIPVNIDALDEYIDYHKDFKSSPAIALILQDARSNVAKAAANRTPEWTIEGIESED